MATRKPKDQTLAPEHRRTKPTQPPLEGGAYGDDGRQIAKLEDAPRPERKEE